MSNKTVLYCQNCGKIVNKDEAKDVLIEKGQRKGLILQLCSICTPSPSFRSKAIYK